MRADIRSGLPIAESSLDYIVAIHVLQDLPYPDVLPALRELLRMLKPGGTLRLGLPDLDRAIDAYRRGDSGYFYVPDADARSLGAKLVVQIIWYGSVRTPFTWGLIGELATAAGFAEVTRCAYRWTASGWPDIVELDNRQRETLFVEATK